MNPNRIKREEYILETQALGQTRQMVERVTAEIC
jgi:hypothetical protein